jgi:hypothetical protein
MPKANQIHVDQLLGNISVQYKNSEYIAREVFPEVSVNKTSDLYRVFDRNFRLPESIRAFGARSKRAEFDISTASYNLEKHSLHEVIADEQADNYDLANLRSDTTEFLTDKILLRMEKSVADLFTTTSWSQNVSLTAAQQWSADTTTSNPIPLMDTAATTVLQNSGFKPNLAIIPHDVMIAAKNHSQIIERIKYTSTDISKDMIGGLLGVENMLVPTAVLDSSQEGVAASIGPIFSDNVFVGYRAPRPSPLAPSAGYIFRKPANMVKRWREEELDAEVIETTMHYQAKVVASLAGYLIRDVLA